MSLRSFGHKVFYAVLVLALVGWLLSSRLKQDRNQAAEALSSFDVALCTWTQDHDPAPVLALGREAVRRAPSSPEALLAHQIASAIGQQASSTLPPQETPILEALRRADVRAARALLPDIEMPERRRAIYGGLLDRLEALVAQGCAADGGAGG